MKYFLICLLLLFFSCEKKYDLPPATVLKEGATLSIQQLKQNLAGSNSLHHFSTGDTSIYLTITMDESSGNLYKQVYATDDQGSAILLKLLNSGGLYQGDKIRINFNGCYAVCANNMVSIDSLDLEKSVVKLSSGTKSLAKNISMTQVQKDLFFKDAGNLQAQLVTISNVEFNAADRGKTLANVIGKSSYEYELGECYGFKISVRTSGLARFAGKAVPSGSGQITGILQQYNNDYTLLLRDYAEMAMNQAACGPPDTAVTKKYLYKDFDDQDLLSGGWQSKNVLGQTTWTISNYAQSSYYARIYNKSNNVYEACEAWLISPEVDLQSAIAPVLSFQTANSSTISPLSLMISENYVLGNPSSATWQEISFPIQKSSFTYFPTGDLSLNNYKGKKIHVAWKYTGTASSGSIWNVDVILVKEK